MGNLSIFQCLLTHAAIVAAQSLPSLHITVQPLFNGSDVESLNMTLKISDARIKANNSILSSYGPRYGVDNPLVAIDDKGPLLLESSQSPWDGSALWSVSRDPVGEIRVHFLADPLANVSGVAGRGDLRYDQGGVFGVGQVFIPFPPADEQWNMSISWDIPASAPSGVHFTSSMSGEEVYGVPITGVPAKTLAKTVLAVGEKLQRWPSWNTDIHVSTGHEFAVYWMEDLPWDTDELSSITKEVFNGTANYFSDYDSPFRVFFRRDFEAYGGVGTFQSFLMEYHLGSEEENTLDALTGLISHEIIHNYAILWPDDSYEQNWYTEGIADYLGIISPFLSGAINRTHWIQWMNDQAQDYYTGGSALGRSWDDVVARYFTSGTANVKTAYTRGFMYLAYVQGLIHDATNGASSIEDVILPMYKLYMDGQMVGKDQFMQLLSSFVGQDVATASFELMANGTTLVPSTTAYSKFGLSMVRHDEPKFSAGMSEGSFGTGTVTGLVAGSTAEQAGLKEGDQIASNWSLWGLMDTLGSMMRIVVIRDGKEVTFDYWPRNPQNIVECWQWVDITS